MVNTHIGDALQTMIEFEFNGVQYATNDDWSKIEGPDGRCDARMDQLDVRLAAAETVGAARRSGLHADDCHIMNCSGCGSRKLCDCGVDEE
jgi:hypothetical protein